MGLWGTPRAVALHARLGTQGNMGPDPSVQEQRWAPGAHSPHVEAVWSPRAT